MRLAHENSPLLAGGPVRAAARWLEAARLAAVLGALLALAAPATPQAAASFKLIVHPGVAGGHIPRAVVARIFLRQVPSWSDGSPIQPIDHSLTSSLRLEFAKEVLEMSALEINQYWRSEMPRGILPPTVKQSDEETIAFVASHPGAIGYVAASTPTPGTVKVLRID